MDMNKHNQDGAINVLLVPLILAGLFLIGAISFGAWSYAETQKYKNNSDQIVARAVSAAKQEESAKKDLEFAEEVKKPLKTYTSPEQFGSVTIQYPKTWSAYINASNNLVANFNPDFVSGSRDAVHALKVQVLDQSYSDALRSFQSNDDVQISAYALPKVPEVVGVRIVGQIATNKQGTVILVPVRDKTLRLDSESSSFAPDLENNILPNLSFRP